MQISKNFTKSEFEESEKAKELGIQNSMSMAAVGMARRICAEVLQPLRDYLELPIRINSGFRCIELNQAMESHSRSQHIYGQNGAAVDIVCPGVRQVDLFNAIVRMRLPFDQMILEHPPQGWIHISIPPMGRRPRGDMRYKLPKSKVYPEIEDGQFGVELCPVQFSGSRVIQSVLEMYDLSLSPEDEPNETLLRVCNLLSEMLGDPERVVELADRGAS